MAPIHDTDLAEERWSKAEWEHFELWERVEQRMRRRRIKLNIAVALLFLVIVAIPPAMDRWPYWEAQRLNGRLTEVLGGLKRRAAIEHLAFRIRFDLEGSLSYSLERAPNCSEPGEVVDRGKLTESARLLTKYQLVSPTVGEAEGIPGLVDRFCYDPMKGVDFPRDGSSKPVGIAIAPVKDLAKGRRDRVSVLLISGTFGEMSVE
jgi:hypothetical protein